MSDELIARITGVITLIAVGVFLYEIEPHLGPDDRLGAYLVTFLAGMILWTFLIDRVAAIRNWIRKKKLKQKQREQYHRWRKKYSDDEWERVRKEDEQHRKKEQEKKKREHAKHKRSKEQKREEEKRREEKQRREQEKKHREEQRRKREKERRRRQKEQRRKKERKRREEQRRKQKQQGDKPQSREAKKYGHILGLKGKVTPQDIKARYRSLVKQHHPDKFEHQGRVHRLEAEKKMKEINEAYDYFREKYDL